jgi:hypothetical protein
LSQCVTIRPSFDESARRKSLAFGASSVSAQVAVCINSPERRKHGDLGAAWVPSSRQARLLVRLAEFNTQYDRDNDGECFQLLSRRFSKRFFG